MSDEAKTSHQPNRAAPGGLERLTFAFLSASIPSKRSG